MGVEIRETVDGYLILVNGKALSYSVPTLDAALAEAKEILSYSEE